MKHFLKITSSFILCAFFAMTTVQAAGKIDGNERKVLDALQEGVVVDGKYVTLDTSYITSAENYFIRDGIRMNDEQASVVLTQIASAKQIIVDHHIKELMSMPKQYQDEILSYARIAAETMGLTLVADYSTKTITIKDSDGNVLFSAAKVIKNTGDDYTGTLALSGAIAILLAGTGLLAAKKGLFTKG